MTKLFVLAGELSGDLHGGNVLKHLKSLRPDLDIIGTGGEIISQFSSELYYHTEELEVIGFIEVAKRYKFYKGVFDFIVSKLDEVKPDAILLIDYPGFNLKLAAEAKKRGIKVIYYIAPQVWAWKKNRVEIIRQVVDHLIVLFPFEVEFFKNEGIEAHCFGHPLIDLVRPSVDKEAFFKNAGFSEDKRLISLLPGSRTNELNNHMPLIVKTAEIISQSLPELQFVLPIAPTTSKELIEQYTNESSIEFKIIKNDTYNAVAHSDFALVTSGTATLETAILGTPEIIFYKSSLLTYLIGKYIVKIKRVGLPNIIAGREIVPEDPHFVSPEKIANWALTYLNDTVAYNKLKEELAALKADLGKPGAYENTAQYLHSIL